MEIVKRYFSDIRTCLHGIWGGLGMHAGMSNQVGRFVQKGRLLLVAGSASIIAGGILSACLPGITATLTSSSASLPVGQSVTLVATLNKAIPATYDLLIVNPAAKDILKACNGVLTCSTTTSLSSPGAESFEAVVGTSSGQQVQLVSQAVTVTWVAPSTTVPGTPTNLSASATGSTTATVSWSAPSSNGGSGITGYVIGVDTSTTTDVQRICLGDCSTAPQTPSFSSTVAFATSYNLGSLSSSTAYSIYVAAVNAVGEGSAAGPQSFTTSSPPAVSVSPSSAYETEAVTISGSDFGATQGSGYVDFVDNGTSWGAPGDAATFTIVSWSDTQVVFDVPTPSGQDGESTEWQVAPGTTATIAVTNSSGKTSPSVQLAILSLGTDYTYSMAAAYDQHSGPSNYTTDEGSLASGTTVQVLCQGIGDFVGGSDVWDELANGWWVPDHEVTTPNFNTYSSPIPQCAGFSSMAHPSDPWTSGATGWDVSWPNCSGSNSSLAGSLPPVPSSGEIAIVGVNEYPANIPPGQNPCMAAEGTWASSASSYGLYALVAWDSGSNMSYYNYGFYSAVADYNQAVASGLHSSMWWLDFESGDPMTASTAGNIELLQGFANGLASRGVGVGIYSNSSDWSSLTGNSTAIPLPEWFAGYPVQGKQTSCSAAYSIYGSSTVQFTGGPVWLWQWSSQPSYGGDNWDDDLAC